MNTALSSSSANAQSSLGAGKAESLKLSSTLQSSVTQKSLLAGNALQDVGSGQTQVTSLELLPDITASGQITIGDKMFPWNSAVNLDSKNAIKSSNGACSFAVQYSVNNIGKAPAGPFGITWTDKALAVILEKQLPSILPGTSITQKDIINLKPGENKLILSLDPKNQVKETNENNKQFYLQVILTGTCSDLTGPSITTVPLRKK